MMSGGWMEEVIYLVYNFIYSNNIVKEEGELEVELLSTTLL